MREKNIVFSYMTLCSLVQINLCFGGTHCQYLLKTRNVNIHFYQTTQPCVPKVCTFHSHLCKNLKPHIIFIHLFKFNCLTMW
jgi:hypothetical protein